mmetsp:Transcript_5491/g.14894  ORF Transcript_5491/g.14894 Transcript_5491/m.14894 type:complete len:233 (-) Transcript_5491:219-917(-)
MHSTHESLTPATTPPPLVPSCLISRNMPMLLLVMHGRHMPMPLLALHLHFRPSTLADHGKPSTFLHSKSCKREICEYAGNGIATATRCSSFTRCVLPSARKRSKNPSSWIWTKSTTCQTTATTTPTASTTSRAISLPSWRSRRKRTDSVTSISAARCVPSSPTSPSRSTRANRASDRNCCDSAKIASSTLGRWGRSFSRWRITTTTRWNSTDDAGTRWSTRIRPVDDSRWMD